MIEALLERTFHMLKDGHTPDRVEATLIDDGIPQEAAKIVVARSLLNLANYRQYKRNTLLPGTTSEMWWGIAIIFFGFILSYFTPDAPGRFQGLHLTAYLVGAAFIGHAIYWKMKAGE